MLLLLPSCAVGTLSAGYLNLELEGSMGYVDSSSGGSGAAVGIDVDSGFGQGGRTGSPYARVELDSGADLIGAGIFASGFIYDQQGRGTLSASFGDITAMTAVATDFNITNLKVGAFLSINIADIVFIRPGLAADLFLPDMTVTSVADPTLSEKIDDLGGVPLPNLQVGIDLDYLAGFIEIGYLPLDSKDLNLGGEYDVKTETWDIEAKVAVRPVDHLELFAGYRLFHIDLEGTIDNDRVNIDLDLGGFMVGGGFYW